MNVLYFIAVLLYTVTTTLAQNPMKELLYVGTYSEGGSKGIYVLEFDRRAKNARVIQTVHDKKNPTFLAIHPNQQFLYAAYREGADESDKNGTIMAYQIDQKTGELTSLNQVSSKGASPCHISVDPTGKMVYVSNYQGGSLAAFKISEDGRIERSEFIQHSGKGAHPQRQNEPHMHSMIPSLDGKYVYASDLGIDKIMIYQVNTQSGKLNPAGTPFISSKPGAGPRHFVIHQDIPYAYSVEELSNTVAIYKVNPHNGGLKSVGRINMLSEAIQSGQNSAADIHISVDGKHLYASNRGQDNLAIYAINGDNGLLSLVGHQPSGGKHPRNFKIDNKGEFVFVANMESNNVVVFSRDNRTGMLSPTGLEINIPRAVCVEQIQLS
jgi:6-phosphogluconolactonase